MKLHQFKEWTQEVFDSVCESPLVGMLGICDEDLHKITFQSVAVSPSFLRGKPVQLDPAVRARKNQRLERFLATTTH